MNLGIILYLVGFLRTVVVILVIYFAIRIISKYIIPLLFQNEIKKMQAKMNQQYKDQQHNTKKQGDVTIEYNSSQKTNNNNQGDYIDFEEVE